MHLFHPRSPCRANHGVMRAAAACACCGSERSSTFGEDMTEILDMRLRRWKVFRSVREKVTCRGRESIATIPTAGADAR